MTVPKIITRLFFFVLLATNLPVAAGEGTETLLFSNNKEGTSELYSRSQLKSALKKIDRGLVVSVFTGSLTKFSTPSEEVTLSNLLDDLTSSLSEGNKRLNNHRTTSRALIIAREENLIDDVLFQMLAVEMENRRIEKEWHDDQASVQKIEQPLSLKGYLEKRGNLLTAAGDQDYPYATTVHHGQNPLGRKRFKTEVGGRRGLSPRERLYYRYTHRQIRAMADIFKRTLDIINAENSFITIKYGDQRENLVFDLSPTEQYRLAMKIYKNQLNSAMRSSHLVGANIQGIDVIASAYELGVINADEISEILKLEGFFDPGVSKLKKLGSFLYNIGKAALISNPATTSYAIIATLLLETIHQGIIDHDKVDHSSHLF